MGAVLDRHVALGESVGNVGDVASHRRRRVSQGSAKLDRKAIRGICVVTRPVLRPIVQDLPFFAFVFVSFVLSG